MDKKRMFITLLALLILPHRLWAWQWSETGSYNNQSGFNLESMLQAELWEDFSLSGTYFSTVRLKPLGWQAGASYLHPGGLTGWVDYSTLSSEQTLRAGGGSYALADWSTGSWGLTAEAAYSRMENISNSNQAALIQWEGTLTSAFTFSEKWDLTLAFSGNFYNLKLSPQLQVRFQELLQDRGIQNLILGDFLLYLLKIQAGYTWDSLGYTALILKGGINWDDSSVFTGGALWDKEILDGWSLSLNGEYSSRRDVSASAGISLKF
jgi:hypothetical protein